jgi:replicative DNA helicase
MIEQFEDITRALPHAVGPEKSVLSSMMQMPQEFIPRALEERLTPEHFYLPANAILYAAALELYDKRQCVELISLVQHLLDTGRLDRCGGPSAVVDVHGYAPTHAHWEYHLKIVKDKQVLRQLIQNANNTIAAAYDNPGEAQETLDEAERSIMAIRDEATGETVQDLKSALNEVKDEMMALMQGEKKRIGLTTGFAELDHKTLGLKPGELFVVAARPSMGKSALMGSIVDHMVFSLEKQVQVFSAEMTTKQLIQRTLCSRAKFDYSKLADGQMPDRGELLRLQNTFAEIAQVAYGRLHIDDTPAITIAALRAKARRAKARHGIDFIAVDYLQLLRSKSRQAEGSREREISEISGGLKALAKELHIPILVLAQLNRESEKRTGTSKGMPRMSDLRESGAIEQDADMIGLLHRAAYYATTDEDREAAGDTATLILAKNRTGPTGDVHLRWIPTLVKFEQADPPARNETLKPAPKSRYHK